MIGDPLMLHMFNCQSFLAGLALILSGVLTVATVTVAAVAEEKLQYDFEEIRIPAAKADEPVRETVSVAAARDYLEQGTLAWNSQRKCVSCHTNGTYMVVRPALTPSLGPPESATHDFYLQTLPVLQKEDRKLLKRSTRPAQVIYLAAGLAEWDAFVTGELSPETDQALRLMFEIQTEQGTWGTLDCWPPYESDAFHEATVAAMAVATAPGWLENIRSEATADQPTSLAAQVDRLRTYLQSEPPPHDYGRVLLLWAATRWPDLLGTEQQEPLMDRIRQLQRPDGGWSIRNFAAPEAWGRGNRAEKLRGELDFDDPASDGHMTGLAIIVLRSAGIPADDPALQRGVRWLQQNQRVSGRWWTRSLNTDAWHFITYSGTAFPLLALQMCDALPAE